MSSKYDAKCSPKIMQNVLKNECKGWSKNNAICSQEWMETKNQCQMYSKNNAKCSPKIMQTVVQIWYIMWSESNVKWSKKLIKTVVQN